MTHKKAALFLSENRWLVVCGTEGLGFLLIALYVFGCSASGSLRLDLYTQFI